MLTCAEDDEIGLDSKHLDRRHTILPARSTTASVQNVHGQVGCYTTGRTLYLASGDKNGMRLINDCHDKN